MSRRWASTLVLGILALPACATVGSGPISCGDGADQAILSAQAVPTATLIPCIKALPAGLSFEGFQAETGSMRFQLIGDAGGTDLVQVELRERCDSASAIELADDPGVTGVSVLERRTSSDPTLSGVRYYRFEGGCVAVSYDIADGSTEQLNRVNSSLGFVPRSELVTALWDRESLILCGAGAPPCAGASG